MMRKASTFEALLQVIFWGAFSIVGFGIGIGGLFFSVIAKDSAAFLVSAIISGTFFGLSFYALQFCACGINEFRYGSSPERLHAHLNKIGFAWTESRADLAKRYGIKFHPAFEWNVVEVLSRRPFVRGMIWPLSYFPEPGNPSMPPDQFQGYIYYCDNPQKNLCQTVRRLRYFLGPGNKNGTGHVWNFGIASVQLIVWEHRKKELDLSDNPIYEREHKLKTACHITVNTGYRPPLSFAEIFLLRSFIKIASLQSRISEMPCWYWPAPEYILEFTRMPKRECERVRGLIGWSADCSTLIWFNRELFLVPLVAIIQFEAERVLPAKGHGGAWLSVRCRCIGEGKETKLIPVCSAPGAEDLNGFSELVASVVEKPYLLRSPTHDC